MSPLVRWRRYLIMSPKCPRLCILLKVLISIPVLGHFYYSISSADYMLVYLPFKHSLGMKENCVHVMLNN